MTRQLFPDGFVVTETPPVPADTNEAIKACMESYLWEQLTPAMMDAMRLELQLVLHRAGIFDLTVEVEISSRRYDQVDVGFRNQRGELLLGDELPAHLAAADARRR